MQVNITKDRHVELLELILQIIRLSLGILEVFLVLGDLVLTGLELSILYVQFLL